MQSSKNKPGAKPAWRRLCAASLLWLLGSGPAVQAAWAADNCSWQSGDSITPVLELYTSEGCSSCPPADRWLSRLPGNAQAVVLAFHVDYWDRLGWKDKFAQAQFSQRQAQEQAHNGARFSYTPQLVLNGADRKDWPSIRQAELLAAPAAARVRLKLVRDGARILATVQTAAGAPSRLGAFWAVTEQGHSSQVLAGENQGALLKHDHVVTRYQAVSAWASQAEQTYSLSFTPARAGSDAHARQVNLVVFDALSGKPVQAGKLSCPA